MSETMGDWPTTIPAAAQGAAERWPNKIAIIEGDRSWTFAQLWDDARACASACIESGMSSGDTFAIWAPNSRAWIVAALGAQIVGGRLVPLNTRFKGAEAHDILKRAEVKLLFTVGSFLGADYRAMLAGLDLPQLRDMVLLEDLEAFMALGRGAQDPRVAAAIEDVKPDDISDIIFTSGTTGAPKGALSAHGQVTQTFGDWARRVDLRHGDRYLIVNPFFHTFGYKAGWVTCLLLGATIVPMATFDVAEVVRQIETNRINFIPGPPTIYECLLAELAGDKPRDFSSLRVAVTGAAPVAPALVDRMRNELGMQNVVNGYGMTECGVITMTRIGDDPDTVAQTCGFPMPGMEIRCVDDAGADVPVGESGEILVRSFAVMRGYLNDPAATKEAIDADGWLHTGDVGALDERGYLRITDRKKDVYISGGFNCYPAEVEKLLAAHPAIEVAAVIGVPDQRMGEVGKAFVILRPGRTAEPAEIITWARENMANFKAPRSVEIVTELPRNAFGKVLRIELRRRELAKAEKDTV